MDLFFGTVASLLSLLMRSLIENTLNDLVKFLNNYKEGNAYTDNYENIGFPHLVLPFTCYLSIIKEDDFFYIL